MAQDILEEMLLLIDQGGVGYTARTLKHENNKWLVRSALQKAMRRGQTNDAVRLSEYLLPIDEGYAFAALATIMVEDIGVCQPDLVSYSTILTLKSVRDKVGKDLIGRLFVNMVAKACTGPKSRACCEISLGCDLSMQSNIKMFESEQAWSEDGLVAHLPQLADAGHWKTLYCALVAIRKRYRHRPSSDMVPTLKMIMLAISEPSLRRACMMSFERPIDGMSLAMVPAAIAYVGNNGVCIGFDEMPQEVEILSVSSAAFDMHTMLGKQAIRAYGKWLAQGYAMFKDIPAENVVKAVGSLVFIEEGGLVDHRICGGVFNEMKAFQDYEFPLGYGMPAQLSESVSDMRALVWHTIPQLNEFRRKAAS